MADAEDMGRYDWPEASSQWECANADGNCCGGCRQCIEFMMGQDIAHLRGEAL
jgi:hypothetical protein